VPYLIHLAETFRVSVRGVEDSGDTGEDGFGGGRGLEQQTMVWSFQFGVGK